MPKPSAKWVTRSTTVGDVDRRSMMNSVSQGMSREQNNFCNCSGKMSPALSGKIPMTIQSR